MKVVVTLLTVTLAAVACGTDPKASTVAELSVAAAVETAYTGTLVSLAGVGGESTGLGIEVAELNSVIEVSAKGDLAKQAASLVGQVVIGKGRFESVAGVEIESRSVLVLSSLVAAPSRAVLHCADRGAHDTGYRVTFFADDSTIARAKLQMISDGADSVVADYTTFREIGGERNPDAAQDAVVFYTTQIADGGFDIALTSGNIAGIQFAKINAHSFFGTRQVAVLTCVATPRG